jgi:ATP-dependent protease Clp ATPase subunit
MNNSRIPPPPQKIYEYLNGNIVGHYIMKKALSVSIYNHFCDTTIGTGVGNGSAAVGRLR